MTEKSFLRHRVGSSTTQGKPCTWNRAVPRGVVVGFLGLLVTLGWAQATPPATKPKGASQNSPCALLSKDELLEALKSSEAKRAGQVPAARVEKVEEDPSYNQLLGYRVCFYSYSLEWTKGDKWDYLIRVSYDRSQAARQELEEVKSKIGKPDLPGERVPGLGEEAFWVDHIRLYVWEKGGLLKIDHVTRANQKDLSILLAKVALGRIR